MNACDSQLKVAHVLLSMDCGGMEHVVLELARLGKAELGQDIHVICLERPGQLAPDLQKLGVDVHCLHKQPGFQLRLRRRLRKLFAVLRPTVVHSHHIGSLFYAGASARKAGVPVVVHTEHGARYGRRRRTQWLGRLAAKCAQRFYCVSGELAAEVSSLGIAGRDKIEVVRNGVNTSRFMNATDGPMLRDSLRIHPESFVIGTVGRLEPVKRPALLLNAFARLKQQFPCCDLVLVGDGPLLPQLRELAGRLSIADAVRFVGYQRDREHYVHMMDAFALTSRSEGMPLVILEAMAASVPVIASAVGGVPEIIDDGHNGLLFPSGDADALASCLAKCLMDRHFAKRLAVQGNRDALSRWDTRTMARVYHDRYLQLLGNAESEQVCPFVTRTDMRSP